MSSPANTSSSQSGIANSTPAATPGGASGAGASAPPTQVSSASRDPGAATTETGSTPFSYYSSSFVQSGNGIPATSMSPYTMDPYMAMMAMGAMGMMSRALAPSMMNTGGVPMMYVPVPVPYDPYFCNRYGSSFAQNPYLWPPMVGVGSGSSSSASSYQFRSGAGLSSAEPSQNSAAAEGEVTTSNSNQPKSQQSGNSRSRQSERAASSDSGVYSSGNNATRNPTESGTAGPGEADSDVDVVTVDDEPIRESVRSAAVGTGSLIKKKRRSRTSEEDREKRKYVKRKSSSTKSNADFANVIKASHNQAQHQPPHVLADRSLALTPSDPAVRPNIGSQPAQSDDSDIPKKRHRSIRKSSVAESVALAHQGTPNTLRNPSRGPRKDYRESSLESELSTVSIYVGKGVSEATSKLWNAVPPAPAESTVKAKSTPGSPVPILPKAVIQVEERPRHDPSQPSSSNPSFSASSTAFKNSNINPGTASGSTGTAAAIDSIKQLIDERERALSSVSTPAPPTTATSVPVVEKVAKPDRHVGHAHSHSHDHRVEHTHTGSGELKIKKGRPYKIPRENP